MNDKQDMEFEEVRDAYEKKREKERKKLLHFLKEDNNIKKCSLTIVDGPTSGKGKKHESKVELNRTSIPKLEPPYDLKNWKWVELLQGDFFNCVVSLNMLEVDQKTANVHALYDRVGLLVSYKKGHLFYKTEVLTDIELPFDNNDMERIATLIAEQFDLFNREI